MYLKISFIIIGSFCFSSLGFSQSLEEDFERIVSKMDSASSVSINVSVRAYSQKGGQVIYSTKASVAKSGDKTMNILGEMEIISTPKYDLKIDHEERAVLILEKDTLTKISMPELSDLDIKKLRKYFDKNETKIAPKIRLISSANGIKKYAITELPELVEMQIHLNSRTNKLVKITYEYGNASSKGQYVVLTYSKFQYDSNLDSIFDLTNYFTTENNKYVLNDRLKGYKTYTER